MATANPYAAPTADDIGANLTATYEPKVFSFSGRIGRLRYLAYSLAWSLVVMAAAAVLATASAMVVGMMAVLILLQVAALVSMFSLAVRRLNDLGQSGWWSLLLIVPFANLAVALYILFWPGTSGQNRFGAAPVANTTPVIVGAILLPVMMIIGTLAVFAVGLAGMDGQAFDLDYDLEYYVE